jgi:hypothetical protein
MSDAPRKQGAMKVGCIPIYHFVGDRTADPGANTGTD